MTEWNPTGDPWSSMNGCESPEDQDDFRFAEKLKNGSIEVNDSEEEASNESKT